MIAITANKLPVMSYTVAKQAPGTGYQAWLCELIHNSGRFMP